MAPFVINYQNRKNSDLSYSETEIEAAIGRVSEMRISVIMQLSDMGDFIWKSPSIIENELKIEAQKVNRYFPVDGCELSEKLRAARLSSSERRIEGVYPYMLSTGNFFASLSALEAFLLMLAKEVDILFGGDFKVAKGMGLEKINNHLRHMGIELDKAECYTAISSAYSIRNCLVHCAGVLSLSRDSNKLKNIVSKFQYLAGVGLENARKGMKSVVDVVSIVDSQFGERLMISNDYAHIACAYAATYFSSLCELVITKASDRRRE